MPTTLKLEIPKPNIQSIPVVIEGTNALIFHKWSEKAKQMILDKQMKKASKGREIRNPDQDVEDSYYKNSDGQIAFPALCIKQAMVNAARNVEGVTMALLRGSIFVLGDKDGLIEVKYKEKSGRSDMVRVGMGTADIRFRGQVNGWSMKFVLKFNADVVSAEQVINLLNIAGFSCGLGEWRPERNGDFGTFQVSQK
jgi:hypothetical protein